MFDEFDDCAELAEPQCSIRQCKHFLGFIQPDGTEETETVNCQAFLDGIPDEIAYGDNKHSEPLSGQDNNIVYERA